MAAAEMSVDEAETTATATGATSHVQIHKQNKQTKKRLFAKC